MFSACDNQFKAEKVISRKGLEDKEYFELYLISNFSKDRSERYKTLLDFIQKSDFWKKDSSITSHTFVFYDDCYCTRNYIERIDKLENSESLVERCENEYCGTFVYEKSQLNSKMWHLTFPRDIKDTIYIE